MIIQRLQNRLRALKEKKTLWSAHLHNLALRAGLRQGHTDYVRFIVLGRSRVGSNLLRGLLNSHSQVRLFGEVFQTRETIAWALPGYGESAATLDLYQTDPARFLETELFHPVPPQITAVGFKLFYYHAQEDGQRGLWPYLQQQTDIRIIHIKRRNILKTHLSRERAAQTEVWYNLSGAKESQQPIHLDYEGCLQAFEQTRQWEKEYDAFFQSHDIIEIIYEELARNREEQMARVLAFLNLPSEPLTPQTHKQAQRPLSEAIANYKELKHQFRGSQWEAFFQEDGR